MDYIGISVTLQQLVLEVILNGTYAAVGLLATALIAYVFTLWKSVKTKISASNLATLEMIVGWFVKAVEQEHVKQGLHETKDAMKGAAVGGVSRTLRGLGLNVLADNTGLIGNLIEAAIHDGINKQDNWAETITTATASIEAIPSEEEVVYARQGYYYSFSPEELEIIRRNEQEFMKQNSTLPKVDPQPTHE